MFNRTIIAGLLSILALAALVVPSAIAAGHGGAVVFSRVITKTVNETVKDAEGKEEVKEVTTTEGGLYAVKDGHLNQLTEDPADTEPAFSADGRTIAFVRDGDLYSVRPDGSGQRQLTSGAELDSAPVVAPNGRIVLFERRGAEGAAADLYTVGANGGGVRALTRSAEDDHEARFSVDGKAIVFVRSDVVAGSGSRDDLYSIRPNGSGLARLTATGGVDEFAPRYFAGGILFSRGESDDSPAAYADIYTMRRNGAKVKALVAGVGSAYVEDVAPAGRTVLFRRDQGLWVKSTGKGRARKLTELPDGSRTNAVLSSDGRRVAAFVAHEEEQSLVSIDVSSGRQTELAEGFHLSEEDGTAIGPVIAWQPTPPRR